MKCLKCGRIIDGPFCECGYNHLSDTAVFLYCLPEKEMPDYSKLGAGEHYALTNECRILPTEKTVEENDPPLQNYGNTEISDITHAQQNGSGSNGKSIIVGNDSNQQPRVITSSTDLGQTETKESTTPKPATHGNKQWGLLIIPLVLLISVISIAIKELAQYDDNPQLGITGYQVVKSFTAGWFDSDGGRPEYTLEEVNSGILGETVTLNSISNGKIGHEFNFVGVSDGTTLRNENMWRANTIEVEEGYAYQVRLYFENSSMYTAAEGVAARFDICDAVFATESEGMSYSSDNETGGYYIAAVHGYIKSTNTAPELFGDSVNFVSERPFHLEYQYGTAFLENTGIGDGRGFSLPDDIVNTWITIGYDEMNGVIPAGYEYDGQCIITVIPVFDKEPVSKYDTLLVRKSGTKSWGKTAEVEEGDTIELQFHFKNYETVMWNNISLYCMLPDEISYMKGSTIVFDSANPTGMNVDNDDIVTSDGIHISNGKTVKEAYVRIKAVVGPFTGKLSISAQSRMPGEYVEDTVILS